MRRRHTVANIFNELRRVSIEDKIGQHVVIHIAGAIKVNILQEKDQKSQIYRSSKLDGIVIRTNDNYELLFEYSSFMYGYPRVRMWIPFDKIGEIHTVPSMYTWTHSQPKSGTKPTMVKCSFE